MGDHKKILSNRFDVDEAWTLPVAERQGAYKTARKAARAAFREAIGK